MIDSRHCPAPRQHVAQRLVAAIGDGHVVIPDRDNPIVLRVRQYRADHEFRPRMEAGHDCDADRQRDRRHERQPRILEKEPDAQLDIKPARADPGQPLRRPARFTQLGQSSQLHQGDAACFLARQPATDGIFFRGRKMSRQFLLKIGVNDART